MLYSNIFGKTAYSVLNIEEQQAVRDFYLAGGSLAFDGTELFKHRKLLPTLLSFYSDRLKKTNVDSFPFLNLAQRIVLEEDLLYTFYIISAEYQLVSKFQLAAEDSTRESLRLLGLQIKLCAYLIEELQKTSKTPQDIHQLAMNDSEKHLKYLGFGIAAEVMKGIDATMTGDPATISEWMGEAGTGIIREGVKEIKSKRLFWNLNSNLVLSVINLLPLGFSNAGRAKSEIALPGHITGYLGWITSYTLLGLDLLSVAKHTLKGPWMSEVEKDLPLTTWERFTTQFDQRKFTILNDFMGATVSLVCFLWLKGSGIAGYFGNVLGIGLLLADVGLSTWRFLEDSTNHNKDTERYRLGINELTGKIGALKLGSKELPGLELQLDTLTKAQAACIVEWTFKRYRFINDIVYKLGVIVAFSVIAYFFFPAIVIASSTQLILQVVGAGLYFSFNIAYTAVNGGLDIAKIQPSRQLETLECDELLQRFIKEPDDLIKRQLYLDMKQLMGDSDYQVKLVSYQKIKMVHTLFVAVLAPTLIFVSMVFLPMGIGIGVLAMGFVLAQLSTNFLKAPIAYALPKFDEEAYKQFLRLDAPTLDDLKIEASPEHQGTQLLDKEKAVSNDIDDPDGFSAKPI